MSSYSDHNRGFDARHSCLSPVRVEGEMPCPEEGCDGTLRVYGPVRVCRKCSIQHTPRAVSVRRSI